MATRVTKQLLEESLWDYAQYINPTYSYGDIHKEVYQELGSPDRNPNLVRLLPRDHLKSHMIATYATWRIARDPAYTILYITADEDLGRLQMSTIKTVFESPEFKKHWPDHFVPEEGRRAMWSAWGIKTDHPKRKQLNIRDETVAIKTVKAGKTGRHPNEIIYDDLVVPENAYTGIGRKEVGAGASQAASLIQTDGLMTAVGTTYHPKDQYSIWSEAVYENYDDNGEYLGKEKLWDVKQYRVESLGDGQGEFLWPRQYNTKLKKWFGWDRKSLARKKAEYFSNNEFAQFYAQYYMEPNDPESARISYDEFEYYEQGHLHKRGGDWYFKDRKLNVYCGMDVASTDASNPNSNKNDYTAIVVVGVDFENFIYVLDIDQFQSNKSKVFWDRIVRAYEYWGFKRLHLESEGGFKILEEALRDFVRKDGVPLIIDGKSAPRGISKQERHTFYAEPRYVNKTIKHLKGGYTRELEDQVVMTRPAHDDILDALCICIQNSRAPKEKHESATSSNVISANTRFGGRRRA